MTQLSRPLQVALAAAGLLVVVWFVALRGHSSNSEPTATTPAHSTHSASSSSGGGSSNGGSAGVYHGSAPGVEGLTRDIQKAHGAATQSEQSSAQLKQKAAQASGETTAASGGTSAGAASTTHTSAGSSTGTASKPAAAGSHQSSTASHNGAAHTHAASVSGQVWVEREIAKKMTVALLFYSPHAYDDSRTRRELQQLIGAEHASHVKIVLRVATASQVGAYGQFTRVASVYQTPTVLLVSPGGVVKPPITGLTDAFSIEQAIDEKSQT